MKNETPLICNRAQRTMTARGYKLLKLMTDKAAKLHGVTRYHKEFKPMKQALQNCVEALVFEHGINEAQLSELNRVIKISPQGKIELPTSQIFATNLHNV